MRSALGAPDAECAGDPWADRQIGGAYSTLLGEQKRRARPGENFPLERVSTAQAEPILLRDRIAAARRSG